MSVGGFSMIIYSFIYKEKLFPLRVQGFRGTVNISNCPL